MVAVVAVAVAVVLDVMSQVMAEAVEAVAEAVAEVHMVPEVVVLHLVFSYGRMVHQLILFNLK